jgi:shikimate 5-dehydrogenase
VTRAACAAILDVVAAVDQVGGGAGGIVDLLDEARCRAPCPARPLVLNATSLGMNGDHLPSPLESLRADQVAYDLVYGRTTPFVAAARAVGAPAHDGLGMLVHQAAEAFTRWSGEAAPVDVMRSATKG